MNLIPPIGASGLYKLIAPYNTMINTNISYTCMAVRKLSDIIAMGKDPFKTYYEPYGLTDTQYQNDLNSGVCIVSLQSNSGVWGYVPSSFIESYPQVNGVSYTSLALMVHLGALPDSLNLSYLTNTVKDIVTSVLGVQPEVQTVATSPSSMISQDNHIAAETARQQQVASNTTTYAASQKNSDENAQLRARITQLEAYILENMP